MSKIFILIFGFCLLGVGGIAAKDSGAGAEKAESAVAEKGAVAALDNCNLTKKIKFQFRDGTTFLVPEAYIYKPHSGFFDQGYDAIPKPADKMSLYIRKDTFGPECGLHSDGIEKNYLVMLQPMELGSFKKVINHHANFFPVRVREEGNLILYREDLKNNFDLYKDFLVPKITDLESPIFFECYQNPSSIEGRAGCRVFSEMTGSGFLTYNIRSSELKSYLNTDKKIKNLIKNFQDDSENKKELP